MQINVQIDTTELLKRCRNAEKRMVYVPVNALNRTIDQMRDAVNAHVRSKFVIRKPAFFFGTPGRPGGAAGKVTHASVGKGRLYAELFAGVSTLSGNRRFLLPKFEEGGQKLPSFPGAKSVAIPRTGSPARPSMASSVPKEWTLADLRFKAYRAGRKSAIPRKTTRHGSLSIFDEFGRRRDDLGTVQWKGRNRTWIMKTAAEPLGAVFRRTGPKEIEIVYLFRRSVQLPDIMDWLGVAQGVAKANFRENLQRETSNALARGIA